MKIKDVVCIYFSPTGTTEKIVKGIANGLQAEKIEMIDCTKRAGRRNYDRTFKNQLVIIGVPVYYGRVPEEIEPFLRNLEAERTPAILVAVYGNRHYDDALKELYDIAVDRGFLPIAGGVFIAEHSYSSSDQPIAHDRPDASDLSKAEEFGAKIREKLIRSDSLDSMDHISVPGNAPYIEPTNLIMLKELRKSIPLTPETDMELCTQCNICVEACPTEAIDQDDVSVVDRWKCMICNACIKICPEGAKTLANELAAPISELYKACQERKEPEWFV